MGRQKEEVVEVAAHLLGGLHRGIEVDVLTVGEGGEDAGHHALLDVVGDTQLTLDALLGLGGLLELAVSFLEFAVSGLNLLGMLVAAIEVDAEEAEDDDAHGDTSPQAGHVGLLGLLLGFHLRLVFGELQILVVAVEAVVLHLRRGVGELGISFLERQGQGLLL